MAVITGTIDADFLQGTDEADTITGNAGNDTIFGENGNDTITGDGGDDIITAGLGNDSISGGAGNDTVDGGDGNDVYNFNTTLDGADRVDLGAGIVDNVFVSQAIVGQVRLTLNIDEAANGNARNAAGELAIQVQAEDSDGNLIGLVSRFDDEGIFFNGVGGVTFDLRNINGEQIGGSATAFSLVGFGTTAAENITLTGGVGNNLIYFAGGGNDSVTGGNGNDFLYGQDGNDTLTGGVGADRIVGGAGDDDANLNIPTDQGDVIDLGEGDDDVFITDAAGTDTRLTFDRTAVGNGNAFNAANQLAVQIQAQDAGGVPTGPVSRADDEGITFTSPLVGEFLSVYDTSGAFIGRVQNVRLGTAAGEVIGQRFANEVHYINGGGGNDTLIGGSQGDILEGGTGDDEAFGLALADQLYGRAGNDRLFGGTGTDFIQGDEGNDTLGGEEGNDFLFGGADDDNLNGGAGLDQLNGESGNDVLSGDLDNDVMFGGDGNDVIISGLGNDVGNGNAGDDILFGEGGSDILSGELGNDTLNGGDESDTLFGGAGADLLSGEEGADNLQGEADNDQLIGGNGSDVLNGNAGNDILFGGAAFDEIIGEAGDDVLIGQGGGDSLRGDLGADIFVFQAASDSLFTAQDLIVDFTRTQGDTIDLTGVDANSNTLIDDAFTSIGSGAFTGQAGQLRFFSAGGRTFFEADTNGDGVADFGFQVNGTVTTLDGFLL